jgi:hypothetical protein
LNTPSRASNFQENGHFVAFRKLHALDAISPYFMGQGGLIHDLETELTEEIGLIGKGKDAINPQANGFGEAGLDELGPDALPAVFFPDDQGAYLCQIFPADVHGAGTEDLIRPLLSKNIIIPEVIIELA